MQANFCNIVLFIIIFILKLNIEYVSASCKGCIELDEYNFDKIIKHFPIALVKFDIAFPYGEKHEAYEKFSIDVSLNGNELADFAVAVVGIKDYGEKENSKLSERFSVGEQYPVIKLFKNGITTDWIEYPRDLEITTDNLKKFIRENTNLYIGLPGCLKEFDELAKKFIDTIRNNPNLISAKDDIINDAEQMIYDLTKEEDLNSANIYVLIMKRVKEKSEQFVDAEIQRISKLLPGKITQKKKNELNLRLNILRAFQQQSTNSLSNDNNNNNINNNNNNNNNDINNNNIKNDNNIKSNKDKNDL